MRPVDATFLAILSWFNPEVAMARRRFVDGHSIDPAGLRAIHEK
jgi:hypothetical protein